jgi:drug/metabolite transporter (DMT)-like permease
VLLAHQRIRSARFGIDRRDVPRVVLLGFLVVPINQGCFLFGLSWSTPTHASLLYALTPLVVLALARRLLGEGAVWSKALGVGTAFAGVVIILLERGLRHERGVLAGDLLLLLAVFAWSLYTVLSKGLLVRYDSMTLTTWTIASGTALCLPALAVPGAIPAIRTLTPPVWGALLYLTVGTSVIAYPLWMYALRNLDASKVAVATNAQPILTGILSWMVFGERFTSGFVLGAALILAGAAWVETRSSR